MKYQAIENTNNKDILLCKTFQCNSPATRIYSTEIKILFITIILVGIICAFISNFAILLATFLALCIAIIYYGDFRTIVFFTFCIFFQNIFLIIYSPSLSSIESQLFIIFKELIVYVCTLQYILKQITLKTEKSKSIDKICNILLVITFMMLAINILKPNAPLGARITAARQIALMPLCYYFGKSLSISTISLKRFYFLLIRLTQILCICGLIIYILPETFWRDINLFIYLKNKLGTTTLELPASFYSYDLGYKVKRLVSFMAEPVATSHLIGLACISAFICFKRKIFTKLLFITCALLCVSKTLLFFSVCSIIIYIYAHIKNKKKRFSFLIISILIAIACTIYLISHFSSMEQNTATGNHLLSFVYGINNATLMGNGVGTAGFNIADMSDEFDDGYTESFFAILIAQIGSIGTGTFYLFLFLKGISLIKEYRKSKNPYILNASIILLGVTFESFISASSISMLGTSLFFIIPGITERNIHNLN